MIEVKEFGRWNRRSRMLPRKVRWVRVRRSKARHFVVTREAQLRARTSVIRERMLVRMASGRSWIVVVDMGGCGDWGEMRRERERQREGKRR